MILLTNDWFEIIPNFFYFQMINNQVIILIYLTSNEKKWLNPN